MHHPESQVLIGIVHNNEASRLESAREVALEIAEWLARAGLSAEIVESGFQQITPQRTNLADLAARFWVDYSIWRSAVLGGSRKKHFARFVYRFLIEFARWAMRKEMKAEQAVWRSINAKHYSLMWAALNRQSHWMIVLEDDATMLDRSETVMTDSVLPILTGDKTPFDSKDPMYINLAGESDLQLTENLQALASYASNGMVEISARQVDTVCAYAMNQKAVQDFLGFLTMRPIFGFAVIDGLMNVVFPRTQPRVLHASPTLFGHGSGVGRFDAWRR